MIIIIIKNRNKVYYEYYCSKHCRAISASLGSILPCLPLPLTTLLVNIIIVKIIIVNTIIVNNIIVKIIIVSIIIIKIIIVTRPKPPYGRQGLAGLWGKDTVRQVHFGVFSTSRFTPLAVSSDWILLIEARLVES